MLSAFRAQNFPKLSITYWFPIRGHSFLPADRVFGRIQKALRKIDSILIPEVYLEITAKFGRLFVYDKDFKALNFKDSAAKFTKTQRGFKISEARVINVCNQIGIKTSFNGDFTYYTILRKGKRWTDFKVEILPKQSTVTAAKKADVLSLIDSIGVNDMIRSFYDEALQDIGQNSGDTDDEL